MSGEVHEECGVAAVSLAKGKDSKALFYLYRMLLNLQHRGQLSAGVTTYNSNKHQLINTYRDIGSVNEVFRTSNLARSMQIFRKFEGSKGIGHTRYATCGPNDRSCAQPFERKHGRMWKWFSFCFNGQLVNFNALKQVLQEKVDYHFIHNSDTEIIMHYLARELKGSTRPDIVDVFKRIGKKFDGAYCIAFVNAHGEMVVARDPWGFRPMVYAIKDGNLFAASESNALMNIGIHDFKSLKPGHLIHVNEKGKIAVKEFASRPRTSHCMFEYVYFSNVGSVLDNSSVYLARKRLGCELAKMETEKITENSVVVPVPDTAKAAADAYAFELGLPSMEGLIRNRFVGRTFIEGSKREDKVLNKYTVVKEILHGKKVFLVDDSIVRGTTIKQIVRVLKQIGGAAEVHIRITCPPIRAPCFYGIDMSTIKELLASKYEGGISSKDMTAEVCKKIAKDLGADSLVYLSIDGLKKSLGVDPENLCTACLTGEYPTPSGKATFLKAEQMFTKGKAGKRTYE